MSVQERLDALEYEIKSIKKYLHMNSTTTTTKSKVKSAKPKAPLTAYQKYMQQRIPQLRKDIPQLGTQERFRLATRQWKEERQ